ncbi:MAG: hypothetical protein MUC56_15065 [Thermoanaerobaculales bacterium]|nr:hypothetical protein [Thermoanaerobaculales bacterium]
MRRAAAGLGLLTTSAFASGIAALVLEVLWGRQLALVFGGSQPPALGLAAIELALAGLGPLLSLALIRLPAVAAGWLPAAGDAGQPLFTASRLALALGLLLLPTTLMGATYPILVRAAGRDLDRLHRGLGRIYAANTLGGVAGVGLAGFVALPIAGIPGSIALAAGGNLAAAVAAWLAGRRVGETRATAPRPAGVVGRTSRRLLIAAAGSGALVLAAETLWHRALRIVLANSTATLTLLLALTLAGLGAGAALGAPLLRSGRPLAGWARLQAAASLLLAVQAVSLPGIAALVRLVRPDAGWARVLAPPLVVGGTLILPVALLLGAAWPLLLEAATPRLDDGGRRIGRMGVANSLGAALGAAVAGLAVLPALGFGRSMLGLAGLGAALAALGLSLAPAAPTRADRRRRSLAVTGAVALVGAAAISPVFGRVTLPSLVGEGGGRTVLAYRETAAGTVVVTEEPGTGARSMFVDNNAVIGSSYDALKVARMLGLVPALLHPRPERVLVIGYGAGVTTATIAGSPAVAAVEVVEIVPGVVEAAGYFAALNHEVVDDPRVSLHANDGRNHLLLHPGPWDVITCDPVHPLYGSAPLYSAEFFALARSRLAPGGIACQYLPLHRMPADAFRRAIATFQTAFPESWVLFGLGHAMLLGSDRPLVLDWERWREVIEGHRYGEDLVASSLHHPAQIAALLQLDPAGCRAVGAGPPSTDLHPRLEFLAPAAYAPGLWTANARLLVEAYTSPIPRIANLPPGMAPELERLVAGKRLLLFSLLERNDGDLEAARRWLGRALQIAGDDPEIVFYARQLARETPAR